MSTLENPAGELAPDFYLASTEGYNLDEPRKCWRISEARTEKRDDLLLVRVVPPVLYANHPYETVIVASRHVGDSVLRITQWPVDVHVAVLEPECAVEEGFIPYACLDEIAWAELYRTEPDARAAVAMCR